MAGLTCIGLSWPLTKPPFGSCAIYFHCGVYSKLAVCFSAVSGISRSVPLEMTQRTAIQRPDFSATTPPKNFVHVELEAQLCPLQIWFRPNLLLLDAVALRPREGFWHKTTSQLQDLLGQRTTHATHMTVWHQYLQLNVLIGNVCVCNNKSCPSVYTCTYISFNPYEIQSLPSTQRTVPDLP